MSEDLSPNPLSEMKARGCSGALQISYITPSTDGSTASSTADSTDVKITLKTVLYQGLDDEGITFLCRSKLSPTFSISFLHLLHYPPPSSSRVVQFRGEGVATKLPNTSVLHSGPSAQIMTSASTPSTSSTPSGRCILSDRKKFMEMNVALKSSVADGGVTEDVSVYKIKPDRMEISLSGEIWDRYEWNYKEDSWTGPTCILPY